MSPIKTEHQHQRERVEVIRGTQKKAMHLKMIPAKEVQAVSTAFTVPRFYKIHGNYYFAKNDIVIR